MKIVSTIVAFTLMCNIIYGQQKSVNIRFNSPCFKFVKKTNKVVKSGLINGYSCEFVFIPDLENQSDKTGKVYYRDWWNFFITSQKGYVDIYPLKETDTKAHIQVTQLTDSCQVIYVGETSTLQRKDFYTKYNTDEWQIDTLSHLVKIIHERTFKYNTEFITVINIQGWDLYVPKKCKTVEGYSLVYSNKRGFVGSYVYFFSKENEIKASSYSFIGDHKLEVFMKKKRIINYFGGGISWECDR